MVRQPEKILPFELFLMSFLAAFLIALGIVLAQFGMRHLPALYGASVSVPTSAVFFLVLSPVTVDWENWQNTGVLIFAVAGLFYPAAVTLLNFASNLRLGGDLTAAMGNLTPLFAIGLAMAFLQEAPGAGQIVGITVIFGGLGLIASSRVKSHPQASLLLLSIPLFGALLRGAAQPLVKTGLAIWPNAFAAATVSYVVSACVIWLVRGVYKPIDVTWSPRAIAWFVVIGLVNGTALLCLYVALSGGQVTTVAPVVATYPLMTYLINRVVLRQRGVSARGIGGIVLSVIGVILLLTL